MTDPVTPDTASQLAELTDSAACAALELDEVRREIVGVRTDLSKIIELLSDIADAVAPLTEGDPLS